MSGLIHHSKPHLYFDYVVGNLFEMQVHVEAERAASRTGALTRKEMRYGDIGRSEVRGERRVVDSPFQK